jgi:hypothetical protein
MDYTNWKPPTNGSVLAGPGFAKEWDFQSAAAEQPGVGGPNLGELLNWSKIPGASGSLFSQSGYGDLPRTDNHALDAWLTSNGYKIMQTGSGGKIGYRWIQDRAGNVIGEPTAYEKGTDKTFLTGAALAAALAAPGIIAAGPGASGAAAGAAGSGAATGATNAALIESAVGTAGYGASSAGAGGGAGLLAGGGAAEVAAGGAGGAAPSAGTYGAGLGAESAGGLVAPGAAGSGGSLLAAPGAAGAGAAGAGALSGLPSWLQEGVGPVLNFIKDNPKLAGALAGGLLGGASGGGDDEPAPYTGPMPTITRGNFSASALDKYNPTQVQQYGNTGLLKRTSGGLGRYTGILGG